MRIELGDGWPTRLVRMSRWGMETVDYVGSRESPRTNADDPSQEIDATGVTVRIASCASHTVVELRDSVWVLMSVRWRQRTVDGVRSLEIHGWMVGMATLQLTHQRAGLPEPGVDLVFESRGRNR